MVQQKQIVVKYKDIEVGRTYFMPTSQNDSIHIVRVVGKDQWGMDYEYVNYEPKRIKTRYVRHEGRIGPDHEVDVFDLLEDAQEHLIEKFNKRILETSPVNWFRKCTNGQA